MAILYIVGTPIGNLEDITLRALRILKEVDCILCEDTRTTKKLLSRHSIGTPTLSYHSHSGIAKEDKIIEMLKAGKNLALVSDAGTPGISDPGSLLVSKIREYFKEGGVSVVVIPGANAAVSALSIAGVPASDFLFLGFLPHKKGRETLFKEIADSGRTVVFYESPHRLMKTLASLSKTLTPEKNVSVLRELTKIHEDAISGKASDVEAHFTDHPGEVRGEFVIIVSHHKARK